ncbi:MAG: hypothetical protein N2111_04430 [Candidatus Sumerlaeaceae bacterium]|nr:hypothetical protein [Candidatus Sumerlaeaceae bacterium]
MTTALSTGSAVRAAAPRGLVGLGAVLLGQSAYSAAYIYQTSFVVGERRVFCLLDDAMISMRYARHFAAGLGLVWNPAGERVEGITNLGWTLIMALVHACAGRDGHGAGTPCLMVQCLSLAMLLANTVFTFAVVKKLVPRSSDAAVFAGFATAVFYPLNTWALQGLEVGLLAMLFSCAVWCVLGSDATLRSVVTPALLLALAVLVRPDAALVGLAIIGAGAVCAQPRARLYRMAWGSSAILVALVLQTAFRLGYYGDPFPNTYYLKMTGFPAHLRCARGAAYTGYQVLALLWPMGLLALLVRLRGLRQGDASMCIPRALAVPSAAFVSACVYSVYVGGDAWEGIVLTNRYVTQVAPCFFAVCGWFAAWCWDRRAAFLRGRAVFAVIAGLIVVLIHSQTGGAALGRWLLLERPPFVEDNMRNVRLALLFEQVTAPGARIAIDYAGTAPYFCDREFVDLLGKSDRYVARGMMHRGILAKPPWLEFYPGHLKWDYAHSIGRLRPDVVCAIWRRSIGDSQQHLRGGYWHLPVLGTDTYWRKDSGRIHWDLLPGTLREVPQ